MKIEKLREGMSFKNYKDFCNFLEIEPKAGNAKVAHFAEIECYCQLGRSGHQIYVKEMYATPIEIKETRGRKGFYKELMQALITDHLLTKNLPVVYISRKKILSEIEMVNQNYFYSEKNVHTLAKVTSIAETVIYDFYNTSNLVFKNAFDVALKNLEQKKIIFHSKVKMFAYKDGDNNNLQYREASETEIQNILAVEKTVLEQMGHRSIIDLKFNPKATKEFRFQVAQQYNTEHALDDFTLHFSYNAYKIIVNDKFIEKDHELTLGKIKDEIKLEAQKDELNQIVCERLFHNARERKQQAIQSNTADSLIHKVRVSEAYIENNQTLIELLINRATKAI